MFTVVADGGEYGRFLKRSRMFASKRASAHTWFDPPFTSALQLSSLRARPGHFLCQDKRTLDGYERRTSPWGGRDILNKRFLSFNLIFLEETMWRYWNRTSTSCGGKLNFLKCYFANKKTETISEKIRAV